MRSTSLAVVSVLVVVVSGCVLSENPLSDPARTVVDEDLCGAWARTQNGRIDQYAIVGRPDGGKLPPGAMTLQLFDVDENKTTTTAPSVFVFFISKLGKNEYWNLLVHPDPSDRGSVAPLENVDFSKWLQKAEHRFLFCRAVRTKEEITLLEMDSEAVAKAVNEGKLRGRVSRNPKKIPELSVHLTESTANLEKLFGSDAATEFFAKDSSRTYKKLK